MQIQASFWKVFKKLKTLAQKILNMYLLIDTLINLACKITVLKKVSFLFNGTLEIFMIVEIILVSLEACLASLNYTCIMEKEEYLVCIGIQDRNHVQNAAYNLLWIFYISLFYWIGICKAKTSGICNIILLLVMISSTFLPTHSIQIC